MYKGTIKFDSFPLQILESTEGFIKALVCFAVPGVLNYYYDDGIVAEAKLPEDILSNATIESANGAPFVDEHPTDASGVRIKVTPDNYKEFVQGALSNAHVDYDDPKYPHGVGKGVVTIYDKKLIQDVLQGQTGVSIGFTYDYDETPGIFDGIPYEKAQKNIIINHLASTEAPRAGADVTKIKLYGDSIMKTQDSTGQVQNGGKPFVYRTIDGAKEFAVDSKDVQEELLALNKRIKADSEAIEGMKAQLAAVKPSQPDPKGQEAKDSIAAEVEAHEKAEADLIAKIEALTAQFKQLEEEMPQMIDEAATDKMDAVTNVKAVDPAAKTDSLSTLELKKMFITKVSNGSIKTDGMDVVKINAHYDAAKGFAKLRAVQYNPSHETMQSDSAQVSEKRRAFTDAYELNQKAIKG